VILKLYAKLGKRFIDHLKGIFAFVIYDRSQQCLLAYRDRFGVKPLYYRAIDGELSFGSEIKVIVGHEGQQLNLQQSYEYLEFGSLHHNNETLFEGVYVLEAAHMFEYDIHSSTLTFHRYWDIPIDTTEGLSEEYVIEHTNHLLDESMRLNLVSDVEVAISLSSGTDSALLAKLAQRRHQGHFKAFTFGFDEGQYDEVRQVRKNFEVENLELYPTYLGKQDMLKMLEEAIYFFESPLGGLGTLSAYNMMKEVRHQKIKVVLAGEGADEVFGGYQYYFPAFFLDLQETQARTELQLFNHSHGTDYRFGSPEYRAWINSIFGNKVLAPDGTTSATSHCGPVLDGFIQNSLNIVERFSSKLHNRMYLDMFQMKLPKLLHFQDRASMASSVEARVPFLDHELVEFIYALGPEYKIRNGKNKHLMRTILSEKFAYQEHRETKHYVSTPQREWLKDCAVRDEIIERVRDGVCMNYGLINFDKFYRDYMDYSNQKELGNSFFIWKVINMEYLLGSSNSIDDISISVMS